MLKILIFTFISFSLWAQDPEYKVSKCGKYKVSGKLLCKDDENCQVTVGDGNLSKLEIKLKKLSPNISYFHKNSITMEIEIIQKGSEPIANVLTPPVQQIRAIMKSKLDFKSKGSCQ